MPHPCGSPLGLCLSAGCGKWHLLPVLQRGGDREVLAGAGAVLSLGQARAGLQERAGSVKVTQVWGRVP